MSKRAIGGLMALAAVAAGGIAFGLSQYLTNNDKMLTVITTTESNSSTDAAQATDLTGPVENCSVYAEDSEASVRFSGHSATALCDQWVSEQSGSGVIWHLGESHAAGPTKEVCQLGFNGQAAAYVAGNSGDITGTIACQALTSNGWAVDPGNPFVYAGSDAKRAARSLLSSRRTRLS